MPKYNLLYNSNRLALVVVGVGIKAGSSYYGGAFLLGVKMVNNKFKFDVVIGNPPYQEETAGTSYGYKPIYNLFMDNAYKISNIAELITPGRFLFNAGATPKAWNQKMLSDKHLKVIFYERKSAKVFSNIDISGGVCVTYRDRNKDFGGIGTFTPYAELKHILKKVKSKDFKSFSELIYAPENYRLTQKLYDDFPDIEAQLSKGNKFTVASNIFDKLGDIFRNVKPSGSSEQYVGLYGRQNNRRKLKWIKSKYIKAPDNLKNYKILVPEFNGSGAIGEVLATPLIGDSLIGGD